MDEEFTNPRTVGLGTKRELGARTRAGLRVDVVFSKTQTVSPPHVSSCLAFSPLPSSCVLFSPEHSFPLFPPLEERRGEKRREEERKGGKRREEERPNQDGVIVQAETRMVFAFSRIGL